MIIKILGIVFIAFGLVDLIGSFTGFDIWTDVLQVNLPEIIWRFTAYIELALGYFLFKLGSSNVEDQVED